MALFTVSASGEVKEKTRFWVLGGFSDLGVPQVNLWEPLSLLYRKKVGHESDWQRAKLAAGIEQW